MSRIGDHGKQEGLAHSSPTAEERAATQSVAPSSGVREVDAQRRASGWIVTNEFLHEGFLYRITRRPVDERAEVHLTRREDEALALAYRGLRNRQIAQRLRVAPSTVGVLLFRAAGKFRVRTRAQVLLAYAKLKGLPEPASTRPDDLRSGS
jgi:DNA-binding CsgD family transcriptional regulator